MSQITDRLTFTTPLLSEAHALAQQLCRQLSNDKRTKQVYLNTLAVYAVQGYLRCMEVETDWAASDSHDPLMAQLMDVADLQVKGLGKLECRPVLPNATVCSIPPEVWEDRIGYVAVQLNQELSEATLLGFVPAVAIAELPLAELRSLEVLLDKLSGIEQAVATPAAVNLSQWLQGTIEAGWQTIEGLLGIHKPIWSARSKNQQQVTRGKFLDLSPQWDGSPVALVVGVLPTETPELDIWVKVCSKDEQVRLPIELEVMVLNAAGESVMQAQSCGTEMIQLKFSGSPGERFSIKVILDDTRITETFIV